ncbi:hypothetical protein KC357_g253 [Hortaea werneckii]|nr:hypothetical protein KC357_g253 [Hortaea werneckii]
MHQATSGKGSICLSSTNTSSDACQPREAEPCVSNNDRSSAASPPGIFPSGELQSPHSLARMCMLPGITSYTPSHGLVCDFDSRFVRSEARNSEASSNDAGSKTSANLPSSQHDLQVTVRRRLLLFLDRPSLVLVLESHFALLHSPCRTGNTSNESRNTCFQVTFLNGSRFPKWGVST